MKYIVYFLISLIIFLFQSTLGQYIAIAGIVPNIMLAFVVCTGHKSNAEDGLIAGIMAGLLQDCFFGCYIGCNLFLYGVIGYTVGVLSDSLYRNNFATPVFFTFIAALFYNFGFFVFNILLKGYTDFTGFIYLRILPELVYDSLITVPVYYIVSAVNGKFTADKINI